MSRGPGAETVTIRPTNNVYTALAGAAVIVQIIALIALLMRAGAVGGLF
jgi:hypothetical protein